MIKLLLDSLSGIQFIKRLKKCLKLVDWKSFRYRLCLLFSAVESALIYETSLRCTGRGRRHFVCYQMTLNSSLSSGN